VQLPSTRLRFGGVVMRSGNFSDTRQKFPASSAFRRGKPLRFLRSALA